MRDTIIILGILGIIEMFYVGYNTKKHEDKIKKCESEISEIKKVLENSKNTRINATKIIEESKWTQRLENNL